MVTEIIKLDKNNIDQAKIKLAADILENGGLVAFPTETVYGLGADALNQDAVKGIFIAKGRPSDNPLIVHVASKADIHVLVREVPQIANPLMDAFWPGPLTLIMKKSQKVPEIITAGLDTVAIRMPSHPVALTLIKACGLPVAAPSANTSGKPSPTKAKHVIDDLNGKVDMIIDAGASKVGLESTVLDLTVTPPMILRPGGITQKALSQIIGSVDLDPALMHQTVKDLKPKSPGMKYTHYSPKADVVIIEGELEKVVLKINQMVTEYKSKGIKLGILATDQTKNFYGDVDILSMGDRNKPETIAANLFACLREFDERNVQMIFAEAVESSEIGLAVMNRMQKAAGFNIIKI